MEIKLSSGTIVEIGENVTNDMELLEMLGELDAGEYKNLSKITKKIFGKAKEKVYDSIRLEDGTVPINECVTLIKEIFDKLGEEGKNF